MASGGWRRRSAGGVGRVAGRWEEEQVEMANLEEVMAKLEEEEAVQEAGRCRSLCRWC